MKSLDVLMNIVYPNLTYHTKNYDWLYDKAIVVPKYLTVQPVNWSLPQTVPAEPRNCFTIDTIFALS